MTVHRYIENDGVLFSTRKLFISANRGHVFGLDSGKIDMRGDIMETRCHLETAMPYSS